MTEIKIAQVDALVANKIVTDNGAVIANMQARITELEDELAKARVYISTFLEYYGRFMDDAAEWMEEACMEIGLPLPFGHAETIRRMRSDLASFAAAPTEGQEVKG